MSKSKIEKHIEIVVEESGRDLRLDKFLSSHPEIGTRSRASKLIEDSLVKKNGKPLKGSYRVQTGDIIDVELPFGESTEIQPLHLPLDIVFEDDDCLVVNKPAGLVVHPSAGHAQDTLVNALVAQIENLSMGFHERRPGIVHRLDKDTSGLLVIAKNDRSHEFLAEQFKRKSVHRIYWALVFGEPKQRKKTIESFLARHPVHRKKFSSQASGKRAITHYELVKSTPHISMLRCRLETGRTHQIRVHLSELNHPIIGDRIYGGTRKLQALGKPLRESIERLQRIGLHACELGFQHPRTGEFLKFFANWPEDLSDVINQLELRNVSAPTA